MFIISKPHHQQLLTSNLIRLLSSSSTPFSISIDLPIQTLIKSGIALTLTTSSLNQHLLYLCLNRRFTSAFHFFNQIASNNIHFIPQFHTSTILAHFLNSNFKKITFLHSLNSQIWDSLILSLFDKDSDLGLSLLKVCLSNGCTISCKTFCKFIIGLCVSGDVFRVIEVLEFVYDANVEFRLDNFVASFVIASCCRIGEPRLGIDFFEEAERRGKLVRNLVTYTAVVNAYCLLDRVDDVSGLFSRMEKEGVVFDVVFYTSWIVGYFRKGFLRDAVCKYSEMLESGIEPDEVCYSVLIDGFSKGGNVEKAVGFLDRMKRDGFEPNVLAYTSIMSAFCKKGKFEEALSTYKIVKELGIPVDGVVYATLVDGACELGKFDDALEILNESRKSSFSSVECHQCIILGLCKKGLVDAATNLFIELNEEKIVLDIGTYMTLLKLVLKEKGSAEVLNLIHMMETLPPALFGTVCCKGIIMLCKSGDTDAAFDLYITMASRGFVPSSKAYYSILRCLIMEGGQRHTPLLLSKFVKDYGLTDFLVNNALLHFLCMKSATSAIKFLRSLKDEIHHLTLPAIALTKLSQNGRALDAYNLVKEVENKLPVLDFVDSSIMVDALCKEGHINLALDLCRYLKIHGISPTVVTYNSIMHGLCRQGCHVEAIRIFDSFERLNRTPTVITYSILIDALCKEGAFFKAEWLLERMAQDGLLPNVRIFNSLINYYFKFGYFERALEIYNDMVNKGLKSDSFTISAVINGFDLKGDMQGALDFYVEVKRKGESPDFLGFLYLIRGLLTKGRMEEARGILKEMLQTKSVRDLISQVDSEVEFESIGSFVVELCDRGCIKEAVTILDEVGCMLFPLSITSTHKQRILRIGTEGKYCQLRDFNYFYHGIASNCFNGEIQKANNLVKEMLQGFGVVQDRSTECELS